MSLLDKIANIVGAQNLRQTPADKAPFLTEPRGQWRGEALAVALPQTTQEVAALVRMASENGLHIIPQGGSTGLVGGQIATDGLRALVVNLSRMHKVREKNSSTLIAEAGCVLADIHSEAARLGRLFPLRLASEGSAQIGGLLATNAGGTQVLRYGSMRNLTLGLEAVLADGTILDGLCAVPKDNSGYNLNHLLIGSEGTLAIITAAVLKLFPVDEETVVAMVTVPSLAAAVDLFDRAGSVCGGQLNAFELIPALGLEFILRHFEQARFPFAPSVRAPYFVLIETAQPHKLEALLKNEEAVVATSETQAQNLWFLRENLSAVQKKEGASIKHDISVPLAHWAAFTERALAAVTAIVPAVRPVIFGHLGDGNLHFNLSRPADSTDEDFLKQRAQVSQTIYALVLEYGGSISAEHGIGVLKQNELLAQKGAGAVDAMRAIKMALDPKNILNPNKIFTLKN